MAAKRLLSFVVFVILSKLKEVQSDEEWKKEQFPNPKRDIEACGRRGKVSWICDPDKILSYDTANFVEEILASVRKNTSSGCRNGDENPGFQIGVAVVKKMRCIPGESIAVTAKNFAKHLHNRWRVGNAGCDDGALLLLSITDGKIYVSIGRRAMDVLTDDQIDVLFELVKPLVKEKRYDISVELAVTWMRLCFVFAGKQHVDPTYVASGLIIFFGLVALCSFCLYKNACSRRSESDFTPLLRFEHLELEQDGAKQSKKSYEMKSCPICLEEFQPETKTRRLVCGHKYCDSCVVNWLKDHFTCPTCRQ